MDPDSCWEEITENLSRLRLDNNDHDAREAALEHLDALREWLGLGGYPPSAKVCPPPE